MGSPARRIVILAAVGGAFLVSAQAASAGNWCVAPNTTCGGTNVQSLQYALDQSALWVDNDRIYLGAAKYTAPAGGFKYTPQAAPLEIVGAGAGKSVLTAAPGASGATLTVTGGGANIHDLTVELPANVAAGYDGLITDGWAENVEIIEDPSQSHQRTGAQIQGYGALRNSTVKIKNDGTNTYGVYLGAGQPSLWSSSVAGQTAVDAGDLGAHVSIDRSRLTGACGVSAYRGTTEIRATIVTFTSIFCDGIGVGNQPSGDTVVLLDGVVVNGPGGGNYGAISASTFLYPDRNVDVTVVNSVVRGAAIPLAAYATGSAHATIGVSYSDLDPAGDKLTGPNASIGLANMLNTGAGAGFADPAAGDFHPLPGSPLIDAGDPGSAPASGDLDGNPLDIDGNGDGSARRDIGAFEAPLPPTPSQPDPVPSSDPAAPASDPTVPGSDPVPPGVATRDTTAPVVSRLARVKSRFRYSLSEAASVRISIQRAVVVGGHRRWHTTRTVTRVSRKGRNSVRVKVLVGRRGAYRALVRATDAAGNRSAVKRLKFASR